MNVLIVEDESQTAALLKEIIEEDKDFMVVARLESVAEAVHYLSRHQHNLDLLFFDIQLADGQSFEIFRHIDVVVPIVFCTAYDEFALKAIKNNGIDYILKPFKEKEIHNALQKYKKLIDKLSPGKAAPLQFQTEQTKPYQQSFISQRREKSIVIGIEEVAMFLVENQTVYLYTLSGEKFPLFKKMEYIESVCDPNTFFRINRQMLVNRMAIHSFEPYFNRKIALQLTIKLQDRVVVSRLKVGAFKEWLER